MDSSRCVDAMYTGRVPDYLKNVIIEDDTPSFPTYKTADMLVVPDSQNELIDITVAL